MFGFYLTSLNSKKRTLESTNSRVVDQFFVCVVVIKLSVYGSFCKKLHRYYVFLFYKISNTLLVKYNNYENEKLTKDKNQVR